MDTQAQNRWQETGDWRADNRRGRELALEVVEKIRLYDMPGYLGSVVKEIIERGRYGGVEVGFCQLIGELVM